jgi:rhodanese-related sulfurtransferase
MMLVKLIYAPDSGSLLGAQVVGGDGVDKRIDVLATAIGAGMSVEDLEQLDLGYSPPLGSSRDVVIQAGSVASNARRGIAPPIGPFELLDELAGEAPPLLLDVRTRGEYERGHLPDALHIYIDELRGRTEDVPRARPVVVYCASGYRSHIAQQILRHHGHGNVRNLLGGFSLLAQVSKLRNEA